MFTFGVPNPVGQSTGRTNPKSGTSGADVTDCFCQIWRFDGLNVYFHGRLPAAALQSRPNHCPLNGQLNGRPSLRASRAWCSHSRTRAQRDQRSQVPLFHNPETNAAPAAWCFESGNPSTEQAGHRRTSGPPPLTASNWGTSSTLDCWAPPDWQSGNLWDYVGNKCGTRNFVYRVCFVCRKVKGL